jgi:hypothetical protein
MASTFSILIAFQLALAGPSLQPAGPHAPLASEQVTNAQSEAIRQLEATTQSVVKRRVDLSGMITYAAGPTKDRNALSWQGAPAADSVVQAAFQTTQNQPQGKQSEAARKNGAANAGGKSSGANTGSRDASTDGAAGTGDTTSTAAGAAAASQPPSNLDPATRAAANASALLLSSALTPPQENALEGREVPLVDAIGRPSANTQRLEIASVYWKLALATADYNWAVYESNQLEALPANAGAVDGPLFASARAAAEAQVLEARAGVVTVQQELADAMGQPTMALPLAADQPLVGPYRTHFDTIFAGRNPPGRSRAIDRGLPHWREAIDLRASAVQAATTAVEAAEAGYAEKTVSAETALYAHRELHRQRRAFLSAVREYNAEIVEYASYVAGPSTSAATIVGMLTRPKTPIRLGGDNAASTLGGAGQPTLADPQSDPLADPNVRQAAGTEEAGSEHRQADEASEFSTAPAANDPTAQPETKLKAIEESPRE